MSFGQYAALAVVVGGVLVVLFSDDATSNSSSWQRSAAYFGAGILAFGLVSCVLVAADISISFGG
jgi:hypothetical protein